MPSHPPPCSYSVPTTELPGPTLTATPAPHPEDRAQRRARLLRVCERLTDLGMELTERAHREALKEFEPPAPRRKYSFPGLPDLPDLPDPTPFRSTTFNDLFVELSRCVRQAVLLEARIDAGVTDHRHPDTFAPRPAQGDPAPDTHPRQPTDQTRLSHERLEDESTGDRNRSIPEILTEICETLGRAADTGLAADLPRALFPAPPRQNRSDTKPRRDPLKRSPAAPPGTHTTCDPPPGTSAKLRAAAAPERRPPPD